jgi:YD repeat-containing protein
MTFAGPPMFRPNEIDRVLRAAERARANLHSTTPAPIEIRRIGAPGTLIGHPGSRHPQSLPSDPNASGTGINPWWRYQEENVPGGGHVMVNVGTGDLILQDDDMSVPHKGIAMAFRRTYNSQSGHNVNATDSAPFVYEPPGMYGNGWTNTFDAHIAKNAAATIYTIFDIDGARYDYDANWLTSNQGVFTPRAGNHAMLAYDGVCGWLWTKKSGTTYYFYAPGPNAPCPQLGGTTQGYTGKLYQIVGRNRNTYLTLSYKWDGNASVTDKINQITVTAESGMTTTLSFADVNGHRLLSQIQPPDWSATAYYGYDNLGNLTTVSRPPNNAAGTRPLQSYGYQAIGSDQVLNWVASPRWYAGCASSCGSDGAFLSFGYGGTSAVTSTLDWIGHYTLANPPIPDGTNTPLQSGFSTLAFWDLNEYYTTGVTTPTFSDTAGHKTKWVVDGVGRPTQTQECTASANQGQQCTGLWLLTNESWDANNNRTSDVDARGYETDYQYDANGNTVAVAQPQVTTAQGTFRPTALYSYDVFNNVTAYCDPVATHTQLNADWGATPPPASDTLCPQSSVATQFVWSNPPTGPPPQNPTPTYEPFGQLLQIITPGVSATPNGYKKTISYATASQGGSDYGLPSAVQGDPIAADGGRTPIDTYNYDANGNVACYSKGQGTWVAQYDALGRRTASADSDDAIGLPTNYCTKSSGMSTNGVGWNTASATTYYTEGAVASTQTPSERAIGVASTYTYDLDGNVLTETKHFNCTSSSTCTAGVTQKWYDGADRLVEVGYPHDSTDVYTSQWLTRYIYDLTQGGNVSIQSTPFSAYGNLSKTQEFVPGTNSILGWVDQRANAFDALDRSITKYTFSPSTNTTLRATSFSYDQSGPTQGLGLLGSTTDPLGGVTSYAYDALGKTTAISFPGDAATPPRSYVYDADGRPTQLQSATYGIQTNKYDAAGRLVEVDEPTVGVSSPAVLGYSYYPDGLRSSLSVTSAAITASPLIAYNYRQDGLRSSLMMTDGVQSAFTWTYSPAGRELTQTDPYTGSTVPVVGQGNSTVVQRSSSYDTNGQLSSLILPGFPSYQSISHDAEGAVLHLTTPAANATFGYSIRGESLSEYLNDDPNQLAYSNHIANGASLPSSTLATRLVAGTADPVNSAVLKTSVATQLDPVTKYHSTNTETMTYDALSRLQTRVAAGYDAYGNLVPPTLSKTATFDRENHTIAQTSTYDSDPPSANMGWGPNGHPITVTGSIVSPLLSPAASYPATYHYDGDLVLFVSDAQGRLVYLNCELLGFASWSYPPNGPPSGSSALSVMDRDYSNVAVATHSASGYTSWKVSAGAHYYSILKPFDYDPIIVGNGDGTVPGMYIRPDGFESPLGTIQGARISSDLGQWTTPDAYAGDVHDPMSQKPYMLNRNNPFEYADPTGYEAVTVGQLYNDAQGDYQSLKSIPDMSDGSPREEQVAANQGRGKGKSFWDFLTGRRQARKPAHILKNNQINAIVRLPRSQDGVEETMTMTAALTRGRVQTFIEQGLNRESVEKMLGDYSAASRSQAKLDANKLIWPRIAYFTRILQLWPK